MKQNKHNSSGVGEFVRSGGVHTKQSAGHQLEADASTTSDLHLNVAEMVINDGLRLVMDLTGEFPQTHHCCLVTVVVAVQSKRQRPCAQSPQAFLQKKADTDVRACHSDSKDSSSSSVIGCRVKPASDARTV